MNRFPLGSVENADLQKLEAAVRAARPAPRVTAPVDLCGFLGGFCLVLDIRRLHLNAGTRHQVDVLQAELPGDVASLFASHIGEQIGIRSYVGTGVQFRFGEQIIPITYSDNFGSGLRPWLKCQGTTENSCPWKGMKMFLPYDGERFACADCHGLTRTRGWRLMRHREHLQELHLQWHEPFSPARARAQGPGFLALDLRGAI